MRSGTPLAEKLARRIEAAGPISVAEFMAACLGDPEHGYYMRRDPFGAAGDFVTAPEISQVFGELIGLWAVATFEAMGSPERFLLVELGPGRGTLMKDALRAARLRPAFLDAAEIALVETSPHLRAVQAATLAASGATPSFFDSVDQLPDGPAIVLANEFFDALPIRQLVLGPTGWAERMVGLDTEARLAFGLRDLGSPSLDPRSSSPAQYSSPLAQYSSSLSPRSASLSPPGRGLPPLVSGASLGRKGEGEAAPRPNTGPAPHPRPLPAGGERERDGRAPEPGAILELRPSADAIVARLAERLVRYGGAALIVDYGHAASGFGDTLQALYRHAYDDPRAHPGEADLTAHVDFAALARTAAATGAVPTEIIGQGEFLRRLGIAQRAERLAAGKPPDTTSAIAAAVERLTSPDAMGTLFKVIAMATPGLVVPALAPAAAGDRP